MQTISLTKDGQTTTWGLRPDTSLYEFLKEDAGITPSDVSIKLNREEVSRDTDLRSGDEVVILPKQTKSGSNA